MPYKESELNQVLNRRLINSGSNYVTKLPDDA